MMYLHLKDAIASEHHSFWCIGFDYDTSEGSVVYIDKDTHPDLSTAIQYACEKIGGPATSYQEFRKNGLIGPFHKVHE